jgi:hypothetical protein
MADHSKKALRTSRGGTACAMIHLAQLVPLATIAFDLPTGVASPKSVSSVMTAIFPAQR